MAIIFSLKSIDRIVGRCLCSLLTHPQSRSNDKLLRIIIIRPGGIGDAALLAPAINSIKIAFPTIQITILAEQRNAGIFQLISGVDRLRCYDRPLELFQALRSSYDVVIDTEQWYRLSAVVARLIRAPIKIGFDTNDRRRMFTHRIQYDLGAYEPDNFLALLKPLGVDCQRDAGTVTMALPLQSVSKANLLLQPLCSDSFVVIFPGASIAERRWGADRFGQVAKRLSEDGFRVVVVGGRDDRAVGDKIVADLGLNLAGMTTLAETAAVIARASLVISGDSGVLHLAVGLNVPTVSLFGPGIAAKWAPRREKHIVINKSLPCSPCTRFGTTPACPDNACCLSLITVAEVVAAAESLL